MKLKSLLCLMLASAATQAYALEIYKGHIVSHKEWATGSAKGSFVPGNAAANAALKLNMLGSKQSRADGGVSHTIFSSVAPATGTAGSITTLTGSNSIYMYNSGKEKQQYNYQYSLCAAIADKTASCVYYYDEIELEAGGSFNDNHQGQSQLVFAAAGTYPIYNSTALMRDHGMGEVTMYSSSESVVTITSDNKA